MEPVGGAVGVGLDLASENRLASGHHPVTGGSHGKAVYPVMAASYTAEYSMTSLSATEDTPASVGVDYLVEGVGGSKKAGPRDHTPWITSSSSYHTFEV